MSMDMTRRIRLALAVLGSVLVIFGISSGATASAPKPTVQRMHHPCDLNKNNKTARGTGSAEDLCMVVWRHHAYTLSNKHGIYQETPPGPAVVVDLLDQAHAEGRSVKYFRNGLINEVAMYGTRDR